MKKINYCIKYCLTLACILLLWHMGALYFGEYILPKPGHVFAFMADYVHTHEFWLHFGISSYRVCAALLISFLFAFPLGIYMGYKKRFDSFFSPFIFITYPIPKIVFLPLFFLILGIGDFSRIFLIVLTVSYQIIVVTRSSILHLDKKYYYSFKSLLPLHIAGTPKKHYRMEKLIHLLIPYALPAALTALRIASGTAIAVLFMTESFATQEGLGFLIMDSWGRGDMLPMFTGILSLCFLGVFLYEFCNGIEYYFCKGNRLNAK